MRATMPDDVVVKESENKSRAPSRIRPSVDEYIIGTYFYQKDISGIEILYNDKLTT